MPAIQSYNEYIYKNGQWLLVGVGGETSDTTYTLTKSGSTLTLTGSDGSTTSATINEFSSANATKLNGIETGAEVNVLEGVQVNGTTLTIDGNKLVNVVVPTALSDLSNDADYVTDASYVHTDNNYTTTEKNKLAGIAAGAEVNVNADWNATSGDAKILNKPTIPTQTSQLTNNSGFITKTVSDLTNYYTTSQTYTQTEVDNLISAIPKFAIQVVQTLPTTNISTTTVYLLASGEETQNLYTEYIYVNNAWEKLGTQTVDLTGYALESDIPTNVSDLTNDAGYLTSYTETDPVFSASAAAGITSSNISTWNGKQNALATQTAYTSKGSATKVPQITTNTLGQVTGITEVTITQPTKVSDLDNDAGYITEYTDTKNTAGATDSSSKLFLVGATAQTANPQTYSQDTAYVGTNGHLYSNSKQVVNLSDSQALTNKTYNGYTLAAASAKSVDTSISDASTSTNLPTSAAVASFVEGKGYITSATDTKNTAGSTDTSSKIFLIGATTQAANPQTYSHDTAYVGTDGKLYSNSKEVVNLSDTQALTNKTYNGYTLAAASAKSVDTSISAASTSSNLPTSQAVAAFVEGKGYTTNTGTVTKVTAGAGLNTTSNDTATDGGNITGTGTLYLTKTGVTAGTYQGITVDKYGRVTAASNQGYTTNTGTITKVQANGTDVASSGTANIPAATTSRYGVTELSSATNSTSEVLAATPKAVKAAYDLAASKTSNTGTVTSIGITAGSGMSVSGSPVTTSGNITVGHSNSITAQTTSGLYPIKIDAQGHITQYGEAYEIATTEEIKTMLQEMGLDIYTAEPISPTDYIYSDIE